MSTTVEQTETDQTGAEPVDEQVTQTGHLEPEQNRGGSPPGGQDDATDPVEQDDDTTDPGSGNAEAAKYRRRLRDTETERDRLGVALTILQTREVERLAAARLSVPSDLLDLSDVELGDLTTDDGTIDEQAVQHALDALIKARPGLATPAPPKWPDMGQGKRQSVGSEGSFHDDWNHMLRPTGG